MKRYNTFASGSLIFSASAALVPMKALNRDQFLMKFSMQEILSKMPKDDFSVTGIKVGLD